MLNVIGRILGATIQSLTAFIFIRDILEKEKRKINFKDIFCIICLTLLILTIHNTEYSAANPIVIFLSIIFGLFLIYKVNLTKSILCSTAFMIALFIAELIGTIIFAGVSTIESVREEYMHLILANLIVGIITILIIKIKRVKIKFIEIISELQKKESIETVTFIILLMTALSLILYLLSKNYTYNNLFIVSIVAIILFILLSFIFFKEKYEKELIIHNYDQLVEYAKTFEEWIDSENINIHESKNQLATLRDMIGNNREALEYIDNIISENMDIKSNNTVKLKNIPKGGLKGLLFYKIILAENQNINLLIDISEKSYNILNKLNVEKTKQLCRLIGIFFDNAIEAAKESETKRLSCEIYLNKKQLNIVISNTYKGRIALSEINKNGYSTKGSGRGKGLYLAYKLSSKESIFKLENRIINEYYVQKIIIKEH